MPRLLSIDEVQAGMTIQSPVKNNYGQTLLGAGLVLTEKHLFMLKTWNINSLTVEGDDLSATDRPDLSDEEMQNKRKEYYELLNWKPRNKNEEDLIELGLLAYIKNYKY